MGGHCDSISMPTLFIYRNKAQKTYNNRKMAYYYVTNAIASLSSWMVL